MNLHEYQAKALLARRGVATPKGVLVQNLSEAEAAVAEVGGPVWVVKAQVTPVAAARPAASKSPRPPPMRSKRSAKSWV